MANAESVIAVDDECKLMFLELKEKRTYRFIIYKIDEKKKMVIVEKVGEPALSYEDFVASLPEDECRYAIFDYDFVTEENRQKNKIFFVAWSPDASRVRSKMIYESSKERFKSEVHGIHVELEATDANEVGLDVIHRLAMAASGVDVDDECKLKFLELKEKRTYRFIIYKIDEKKKMVVVEKVGEPALSHEDFAACLPEDECRYAIFDYEFVTEENCQKSKIFFVAWSPDIARVRSKMMYASSKEIFKRELNGIQVELEATDANEVGLDVIQGLAN